VKILLRKTNAPINPSRQSLTGRGIEANKTRDYENKPLRENPEEEFHSM
jgi:hypothetical protein